MTTMEYYSHEMEDAVFRIDRNDGKEWTPAKRWDFSEKKLMRGGEFLVSKKSDLVLGNPDYHKHTGKNHQRRIRHLWGYLGV